MKPWLLPFLYYGLLIGLSSIPRLQLPEPGNVPTDKVLHFLVYGGLGFLLARTGSAWWVALLIGWFLGGLDEFYQTLVPGRSPSWEDWFADCIGVALGIIAWALLRRLVGLRLKSNPGAI